MNIYILLLLIICIIIFLCNRTQENLENEELPNTDDIIKLDLNKCSKDCCGFNQYKSLLNPNNNKNASEKYTSTNLTCNGNDGTGCLCVTKDQFNYLSNRGN